MSIKTVNTVSTFEIESNGTRLKLEVPEGATAASFSLTSVETAASFAIRLVDLATFASFFTAVADDTPVPEPVSETGEPEVP